MYYLKISVWYVNVGIEKVSVSFEKENVKLYWLVSIFCFSQVRFIYMEPISYSFKQGSKSFFIK